MFNLDLAMSSKGRFRKIITHPFKRDGSSEAVHDKVFTSPIALNASQREERTPKRKNKVGRVFLNLLKKSVPCTSPRVVGIDEDKASDYIDVIDISPQFVDERLASSLKSSFEVPVNAHAQEECSESISPSVSPVSINIRSTPKSSVGIFPRRHKVDSKTSSFQVATSIEPPFATHGDSFYGIEQLNTTPSTANIHRLSIYGCPASNKISLDDNVRVKHKASEVFLRAYPLNIYDGFLYTALTAKPELTKGIPSSTTSVDADEMKAGPSPMCAVVKRELRNAPGPTSIVRRCHFKTRRPITSPRYVIRDGVLVQCRRKRYKRYKHLQTLPVIKEEDEGIEDDDSSSTESYSVPSLIDEDDSCTPPVSVEDLEFEELENNALALDVGVLESRGMTRRGVYGKDQLIAHSLSLSVMSTARQSSVVDCRPSGLRPLLLPVHVALRDSDHG